MSEVEALRRTAQKLYATFLLTPDERVARKTLGLLYAARRDLAAMGAL